MRRISMKEDLPPGFSAPLAVRAALSPTCKAGFEAPTRKDSPTLATTPFSLAPSVAAASVFSTATAAASTPLAASAAPLSSATYKYDYTGNVRSNDVNQAKTDLTPWTYALSADYDNLNRVTKWTDTSIESPAPQNLFYTYDAVGNRTAWGNLNSNPTQNYQTPTVPAATVDQNTSYDKASRMTSQNTTLPQDWKQLTTAGGQVLYEANGNLLQTEYTTPPGAGTYAYSLNAYNDASQLVSHKTAVDVGGSPAGWSNTEEYSYDGDGRRIDWKNTSCPAGGGSCTTQYKQYEYVGSTAVAERQQDGHVTVWYVLGAGGEPLYTLHWDTAAASLKPSIYAKDHLGSIRMVANSGGVENAYRYDAFVVPQVDQKTVANSIQGGGAPADVPEAANGGSTLYHPSLYNLRARLYDPLAGRFLTQDTWKGDPWIPWTLNLYAYVGNNPVNYTDPTGHCIEDLCIGEGLLLYAAGTALVAALTPAIENAAQQLAPYVQEGLTAIGNWEHQAVDSLIAWFSSSKTHWEDLIRIPGGGKALGRLDSEPYERGRRIHVQWKGSKQKYYWDQGSKQFVDADGSPAPKAINDNDELARQAEKIWNRYNPSPEDQAGGSGDGSSNGGDSSGGS